MGKAKKVKISKGDKPEKVGLGDQIEGETLAKAKNRQKVRFRQDEDEEVRTINMLKSIVIMTIIRLS